MSSNENQDCLVCERPLRSDVFMRIKHNGKWVSLCCPLCSDTFNSRKDFYVAKRAAFEAADKLKRQQQE